MAKNYVRHGRPRLLKLSKLKYNISVRNNLKIFNDIQIILLKLKNNLKTRVYDTIYNDD